MTLSREDIREVACPRCEAKPGEPCAHTGKGSQKANRVKRNHFERMQLAQVLAPKNEQNECEVIE